MGDNLIYNGDFSHGTNSWSGSNISVSGGVLTVTGSLVQDSKYMIPVATGRRYRLTYDLKVNTKDSNSFYIALRCYDNDKQHIGIHLTYKPYGSNTNTTLATDLNNGDTTVSLTSASGWPTSRTYQRLGICDKKAWGYNRATYSQPYSTISGITMTLKAAWSGGHIASGTKIAEFEDGSTYFYPHYIGNAALPTDWTTYTAEFDGGNSMRYSTQYFQFSTLGYGHNYSIRNLKIECISDDQSIDWDAYNIDIEKTSIIEAKHFNEIGAQIRYVKDWTSGNIVNTANHWNEFKVLNSIGENLAWGKTLYYGTGTGIVSSGSFVNSTATDGIADSSWVSPNSGTGWGMIDLGYVEEIQKVHIWHYYPDGRTYYNNKVEVSADGVNWWTIYTGQKPETSAGNEILVTNANAKFHRTGEIKANQFYEI